MHNRNYSNVGEQRIAEDLGTATRRKRLNNLQFLWNFMIDLFIVPVNVYDFPVHFSFVVGKLFGFFFGWCKNFPMEEELFKFFS